MNGFHANNMCSCLSLLGFSNTIPDKPAIHVYHHQFCSPLEKVQDGNHFAYLEPISDTTDVLVNDGLQHSHKPTVISNESNALDSNHKSFTTSAQLHTPNPPTSPTSLTQQSQPTQSTQSTTKPVQTNASILPLVPNLCNTINRDDVLKSV